MDLTLGTHKRLLFLKLGGSLITDKRQAETPRLDVIRAAGGAVAEALRHNPELRLVIGHGSGSFGHLHGGRHGTRAGVATPEQWYGFAATGDAAARLNRLVVGELLAAGVPAWSIQPSVALRCRDGKIEAGPEATVALALDRGLIPVVYGDVALDSVRGGTIASTEEIFDRLVDHLHPQRLVLAGEVDGIYDGDPLQVPTALRYDTISPATVAAATAGIGGSHGMDVTGGMRAKVDQSIAMVARDPSLEIVVCSGLDPSVLHRALCGLRVGTVIHG